MNMNTNKLLKKVNDFFDLSHKKQKKKHDKLLKLINKLQEKKSSLEEKIFIEGKLDDTSTRFLDLKSELKVISKLIKKAKKLDVADD